MKTFSPWCLATSIVALLVGCQSPGTVRLSSDTYLLSRKGHGISRDLDKLKSDVIRDANKFAENQGKVAVGVSAKVSLWPTDSPDVLAAMTDMTPANAESKTAPHWLLYEYVFRAVDRDSLEAKATNFKTEVVRYKYDGESDSSEEPVFDETLRKNQSAASKLGRILRDSKANP